MAKIELSKDATKRYNESEKKLFSIIRSRPVSTTDILPKFFGEDIPERGRTRIGMVYNGLEAKAKSNKEPWRLTKTPTGKSRVVAYGVASK